MEEADNPPSSSGRVPLPAGAPQTPGMTELGMKTTKEDEERHKHFARCHLN